MEKFIKLTTTNQGPILINASGIAYLETTNAFQTIRGRYASQRTFTLNLPTGGDGLHEPVFFTGTATGHALNKVIDSTANFTSTVKVGDVVENIDTTTQSWVTSVDSDFQLTISQNGLWSPHVAYKVISGSVLQELGADFVNDGMKVGDLVSVQNLVGVVEALTATTMTLGQVDQNTFVPTGQQYGQPYYSNLIYSSNWVKPLINYSIEKAIKKAIITTQKHEEINNVVEVVTELPIPSQYGL